MATTARLGIDIVAADKTRAAFASVQGQMDRMTRSFNVARNLFAGVFAGVSVAGVTTALRSAIDHMDEMGKSAQKIGVPVEELSKLEYAGRLADVQMGSLETSIGRFSKSLSEMAGGAANPAGNALRAIGVAATDAAGKLRPTTDILTDVADKFAGAKDGAEKTAIAMALFGRAGADMIPMLNGGGAAIAAAGEEARKFGVVVDTQAAQAAEQFNDNMTRLKTAGEGVAQQVAVQLTPSFVELTDKMIGFVQQGNLVEQLSAVINASMKEMTRFVIEAAGAWTEMTIWAGAAKETFDNLLSGNLDASPLVTASEKVAALWKDIQARVNGTAQTVNAVGKGNFGLPASTTPGRGLPSLPALPGNTGAGGIPKIRQEAEAAVKPVRELSAAFVAAEKTGVSFGDVMGTIGSSLASGFNSAIDGLIDKTMTLGEAMQSMARDVLRSVTQLFTNQAFQMLFGGGGSGASGAGGGILGGLIGKLFGSSFAGLYAKGGSIPSGKWGIAGEAGVPEVVAGPATVFPLARGSGNGGGSMPAIQIIDQRRNAPAVEQRRGANGSTQFIIRDEIDRSIARGSHDRALAARTGGSPALTER